MENSVPIQKLILHYAISDIDAAIMEQKLGTELLNWYREMLGQNREFGDSLQKRLRKSIQYDDLETVKLLKDQIYHVEETFISACSYFNSNVVTWLIDHYKINKKSLSIYDDLWLKRVLTSCRSVLLMRIVDKKLQLNKDDYPSFDHYSECS